MMANKKVSSLVVLLVIVLAVMGVIYTLYCDDVKGSTQNVVGAEDSLVVLTAEKEVRDSRVIVSDKYVGALEKGSSVIVVGKDGTYVVNSGVVLVDDKVISVDEETSSVYNLDEVAKSLSSN